MLLTTEFVAVCDDDVVPGPRWLEIAVHAADTHNAIIGNSGRSILVDSFLRDPTVAYQTGRDSQMRKGSPTLVEVDFVGHWWITRTSVIRAMWRIDPATLWTAEDIHLSASALIYNGVHTYVLDYPSLAFIPESHIGAKSHISAVGIASYLVPGTEAERAFAIQYWVEHGWRPLALRKSDPP
jgi:hypothetical protein